jgi:hypothetical protein
VTYSLFTSGSPATRSLAFEFDGSSGTPKLTYAFHSEVVQLGSQTKVTDWQIAFDAPPTFRSGVFTFVAPPGSRSIPGPKIGP